MSNEHIFTIIEVRQQRVEGLRERRNELEAELAAVQRELSEAINELAAGEEQARRLVEEQAEPRHTISVVVEASEVGQRVRFTSYGGRVKQWMVGLTGTVVRIARTGRPVIELDHEHRAKVDGDFFVVGGHHLKQVPVIVDTFGCAKVLDEHGALVREERECL